MKTISRILFIVILVSAAFFCLSSTQAYSYELKFDTKTDYDIYIHSFCGKTTVIKDASIVEVITIEEKPFLVIDHRGFKLNKDAQGYVALDSILAILPKNKFVVQNQ